ncbi:MAG: NfeD family protein [Oscillospiraceae bacterium]|nr:NfeD family protein [Oscillospiraceae bacterium]
MHWIIWLILTIAFVFVELSTAQLVSIWFAIGCIGAGVASLITDSANFTVEIITFIVVTAIALVATRPFVKKVTKTSPVATNADSLIGKTAIVTEEIDNIKATGAVTVHGTVWTARAETNEECPIEADKKVKVVRIDGVKLIVKEQ